MRIGSVAGKNVSVTGLREPLSNFRVPKDNLKSSNNAQIWRLLYLSRIPERKLVQQTKDILKLKREVITLAPSP